MLLKWKAYRPEAAVPAAERPPMVALLEEMQKCIGRRFIVEQINPEELRALLAPHEDAFLGGWRSPSHVLVIDAHPEGSRVGLRPFVVPPGWVWKDERGQ